MSLTRAQKHLINGLHLFGVEKDAIVGIASALSKPEQQDRLMEWMCEHQGATMQEVLKEAANILK